MLFRAFHGTSGILWVDYYITPNFAGGLISTKPSYNCGKQDGVVWGVFGYAGVTVINQKVRYPLNHGIYRFAVFGGSFGSTIRGATPKNLLDICRHRFQLLLDIRYAFCIFSILLGEVLAILDFVVI